MAVVFALLSAASFGAADFAGGSASRRANATSVVLWSQVVGLVGLLLVISLLPGSPDARSIAIGAMAGVAGTVGLLGLYQGLAIGPMSVVSPITAMLSAIIPTLWGLARGDRPSTIAAVGAVLAIVAGLILSRAPAEEGRADTRIQPQAIALALASGAGFGLFFALLSLTDDDAGSWPLIGSRGASLTILTLALLVRRQSLAPPTHASTAVVLAGVFDISGNIAFLAAESRGLLIIVAVVVSLYPASTVFLARLIDRESIGSTRAGGLALGALAVALVAGG